MNLYIFNDSGAGSIYGIGTYIRELTAFLKNRNINVCVVNLFSNVSQMIIEEKDSIKHWHFPKPVQEQRTIGPKKQWELYYRNVIYLLCLHIVDKKDLIFHLNYNYNSNFPNDLRKAFDCKIVGQSENPVGMLNLRC